MKNKYQIIDLSTWTRRINYQYFSTFANPTYGFNVRIDITEVLNYSKETHTSFFINFLYIITLVNNDCPSLRLRQLDDMVVLFDTIHPTYTIKTDDGSFNNGFFEFTRDYQEFYQRCKKDIEENKKTTKFINEYNAPEYDRFYSSCLTTIDILGMNHPIDTNDKKSMNVPRIFWDKYIKENDRYYLTLNMTVSHALIDGEELSQAFNLVRKYCSNFKEIIKLRASI